MRIIALTVKMETLTLIGKGRYKLICFVYCVTFIVKYFYLADILSGRGGGLSYIRVILHSDRYNINASLYISVQLHIF